MRDYHTALTTPAACGPVLASLLGRLPVAMIGLAILFYVQHQTHSFASAGLVAAGTLTGVAVGSVIQGRLMDRLGPSRPLLVACAVLAVFVIATIAAIQTSAPTWLLVTLSFGVGLAQVPVSSASRAMWPRLVPVGPIRQAAYSYEAISMEVFFILGPGIAGLFATIGWPVGGLIVGALCMICGGVWFALTPTVRHWQPTPGELRTSKLLGPLASPGMRTVAVAALGFGVTIGFVEVAVPAVTAAAGNAGMGGLLLSAWSGSSVIFGALYSLRPWPQPIHLRLPVLLACFAALIGVLSLAGTLTWLIVAMLLAGTMIAAQATAHSAAIEVVAPRGTVAEAFSWVITSVTLGLAIGQSVSGQLVQSLGPNAAFLAAAGAGLALAGVVFTFRRTVRNAAIRFDAAIESEWVDTGKATNRAPVG